MPKLERQVTVHLMAVFAAYVPAALVWDAEE
jgi:hypothetical protein